MKKIVYLVLVILGIIVLLGMSKKPEKEGYIYVADGGNARIKIFDRNGKFIKAFGKAGTGDGEFILTGLGEPQAYPKISWLFLVISKDNKYIYVYEPFASRMQKFDKSGNFVKKFQVSEKNKLYCTIAFMDKNGNSYIYQENGKVIQIIDEDGKILKKFKEFGEIGLVTEVDDEGNIYTIGQNKNKDKILKYNSDGELMLVIGGTGSEDGKFKEPTGIAIDKKKYIYVIDSLNYRIQKFDKDGNFILKIAINIKGKNVGQFLLGIAVDSEDNIYISGYRCIQKFEKNGNFLMELKLSNQEEMNTFLPTDIAVDF